MLPSESKSSLMIVQTRSTSGECPSAVRSGSESESEEIGSSPDEEEKNRVIRSGDGIWGLGGGKDRGSRGGT